VIEQGWALRVSGCEPQAIRAYLEQEHGLVSRPGKEAGNHRSGRAASGHDCIDMVTAGLSSCHHRPQLVPVTYA